MGLRHGPRPRPDALRSLHAGGFEAGSGAVVRASLILCDWADVVNDKLYIQGAGWVAIAARQPMSQIAVATLIEIPYDETNQPHACRIKLLTQDAEPYPADQPVNLGFGFEAGRPPGMVAGMSQLLPHAAKIYGIPFEPGMYTVELAIDGEIVTTASFQALG